MSRSCRVVVCGYYGFENLGDEAILGVLIDRIRRQFADAEITVLAGSVAAIRRDHGVAAIHWQDVAATRAAVFAADHVIVGGGGLFEDLFMTPNSTLHTSGHGGLTYYGGVALLAQAAGVPTTIESVGVGPLTSDRSRDFAAAVFAGATAVRVRDPGSAELVDELAGSGTAELVLDPAWAVQPAPATVGQRILIDEGIGELLDLTDTRRALAVSVRPWKSFDTAELIKGLRTIAERDSRPLLFVPFSRGHRQADSDLRASLAMAAELPNAAVLSGRYNASEIASVLGVCDATVAMRLHASILSLRAGTPTVGLAYHVKVADLHGVTEGYQSLPLAASSSTIVAAIDAAIGQSPGGPFQTNEARLPLLAIAEDGAAKRQGQQIMIASLTARAEAADEAAAAAAAAAAQVESEAVSLRDELADATAAAASVERVEHERDALAKRLAVLESGRGMRALRVVWRTRNSARSAAKQLRAGQFPTRTTAPAVAKARPARPSTADKAASPAGQVSANTAQDAAPTGAEADALVALRALVGEGDTRVVALAPSIRWDAVLFQRPQQLALAIGRLGYPTVYCITADTYEVRTVAPNVHLLSAPDGGHAIMSTIAPFAVLTFPYSYHWTKGLDTTVRVLDHIDDLDVFESFPRDELASWFDEALDDADVVSCTAEALLEQVVERRPDAILCPNGVSVTHFAPDPARTAPADLPATSPDRILVGFYGAMAKWMDWGLADRVAERMSAEADFVFIGPDYDRSMKATPELWARPNVYWLGPRDHADLPAYLDQFDVAMIPFHVNQITNAVSPVKLFEYFAGECPVVASPIREALRYPEVGTGADAEDFAAAIRAAAASRREAETTQNLRRRALTNSWDVRAASLIAHCLKAR